MTLHAAQLRSVLPHAAICALPVAAVTFLLHAPLRQETTEIRARLAMLQSAIDNADPNALPPRELAAIIESLGAGAISSPSIYDAITTAANRNAVRVDSISPSTAPSASDEDAAPRDMYAFSIQAVGTFESLLPFLVELEQHCGFTSVRAIQIEPARHAAPGLLQASIETTHTRYTLASSAPNEERTP